MNEIYDYLDFHIVEATVTTGRTHRSGTDYRRFINAMRCWEARFENHIARMWAAALADGRAKNERRGGFRLTYRWPIRS